MMTPMRMAFSLVMVASLSACASTTTSAPSKNSQTVRPRKPTYIPPPNPILNPNASPKPTSIDGVSGLTARELVTKFGAAQQDVREESARKLQFANQFCVMDTYLYPPAKGKTPVVTYVATRMLDGRAAERNSCIMALQRR